jgi:hypothetical protein
MTHTLSSTRPVDLGSALYYPHISFQNPAWVKAAALFYDRVYRIVPANATPDDPDELKPLLEDGSIGVAIDPKVYVSEAADSFLAKVGNEWSAAALSWSGVSHAPHSPLSDEKVDARIRSILQAEGLGVRDGWFDVPKEFSDNYMLYLARTIARRNGLVSVTNEDAAWTASVYFDCDGQLDEMPSWWAQMPADERKYYLFALFVEALVPANISEIPASRIASFRRDAAGQLKRMRESVSAIHAKLSLASDPQVWKGRFDDAVREYESAIKDYKAKAEDIKVKRWLGFSALGVTAPAFVAQLLNAPDLSMKILLGTGLAIGAVYSLVTTRRELRALRSDNYVSILADLSPGAPDVFHATQGRGGYNFHLTNLMEEYIND